MIGVYAGSFDPFTNGHLEIVKQAAKIFNQVIVLVAANPEKKPWLNQDVRKKIVEDSVDGLAVADILTGAETTVEYAYRRGACLIRGLGDFTDYPAEKSLLNINHRLRPEVETVFLMTESSDNQMRSSAVREALKYRFGWRSIRDTVPRATFNAALNKLPIFQNEQLAEIFESADLSNYYNRPYHNLEHLIYMIEMAELWNGVGQTIDLLNLWAAILYHDFFVDSDLDVPAGEDVSKSLDYLNNLNLTGCTKQIVLDLIQATNHQHYCLRPDSKMTAAQKLISKLDMAILGETPYEYARYAKAIREEYAPKYGYLSDGFRNGRRLFLTSLLDRLSVAELINPDYDTQMEKNIYWELEELKQGR